MELDLALRQSAAITPQMMQSMKILQLDAQGLAEYLDELLLENPLLEETRPQRRPGGIAPSGGGDEELLRRCAAPEKTETLAEHLLAQLDALDLPPRTRRAAAALAQELNAAGWLDSDCPAPDAEALALLQSLEPAGVGARSLAECLSLQLRRRSPVPALALAIAQDHLEDLAQSHYAHIARSLGASQTAVREAGALIRTLTPRPGAPFAPPAQTRFVVPEVLVEVHGGEPEVSLNERCFPALELNRSCSLLLRTQDDPEARAYLTDRLRQAHWVLDALAQRRTTLLRCAEHIAAVQRDYFLSPTAPLTPLRMAETAAALGVHESTVSRAVSGKYLQSPRGTLAMSRYFARSLPASGGDASADAARALLARLVAGEDRCAPLSDQQLAEALAARGCAISRRTVAKYRAALGIPSTLERRGI